MKQAPNDDNARRLLEQRAKRLARKAEDERSRTLWAQVAVVATSGQRFGIPVHGLRELLPTPSITPLPKLPAWLRGIAHVRGELIGVVDLGELLDLGGEQGRALAVLETRDGLMGLTFHEVIQFRDVYEDELSPNLVVDAQRPFAGTTRDLVSVLDLARLIALQRITGEAHGDQSSTGSGT